MLVATLAVMLMLANGHIAAWEAVLLLAMAVAYTTWMVLRARSGRIPEPRFDEAEGPVEATEAPSKASYPRLALLIVVGLILLVVGGHCLVQGASTLAKALGMSERLIGLTIVAVGTSVPELATSLVAAWRGHTDIAVGNVVGSNIFNVFLCLGSAGLPGALRSLPTLANPDLLALAVITLVGLFLLRTERTIQRWEGALLLGSYGGYLAYLILQA
ncbi:MAG TPA: sodium:calcium antiporter [Holophaga sp.]|nr:sodium:calcium antiporter [Holophaga sp.]HQL48288.1 sodium:calcium antiporter [Holophaga sp.]